MAGTHKEVDTAFTAIEECLRLTSRVVTKIAGEYRTANERNRVSAAQFAAEVARAKR
jgi:hypothetical protein